MPPASRRRRPAQDEDESEDEQPRNTQRKRAAQRDDSDEEEEEEDGEGDPQMDINGDEESQEQLVKKLVRYALACEYQRIPIRRAGISENVIGKQRGRFKRTFEAAQHQLRTKLGMEMVELPVREKVTLKERRAAEKKGKSTGSTSSASYILTSILPSKYRTTAIMPPSKIGNPAEEAAYTGFYTFVVAIIALSPQNMLSNNMLRRHLSRVFAEDVMPLDKTENILTKMIRQGYIVKTVERTEQDEIIEYRVGPRGKIEIGNKGVQGLVNEVYGDSGPEDLDRRIRRSLGIEINEDMELDEEEEEDVQQQEQEEVAVEPGPSRRSRRR